MSSEVGAELATEHGGPMREVREDGRTLQTAAPKSAYGRVQDGAVAYLPCRFELSGAPISGQFFEKRLASFKLAVSNPSVNQPWIAASICRTSSFLSSSFLHFT